MRSASNPSDALRIVVLGYLVRGPLGGMAWHHLQYVLGLRDLGHEVWFLEDSGDSEYCCYDPERGVNDTNPAYGLRFATDCFERFSLGDRWAYFDGHTSSWLGPCAAEVRRVLADADVLLHLSCSNVLRPWHREVETLALIDTDPVFTQIRNLKDPERRELVASHHRFFTFGENFSEAICAVPDDGFPWQPTRQPIVLEEWPATPSAEGARYTTVMQWQSYPTLEWEGRHYGTKADSFADYIDFPSRTPATLELAVGGSSAPRQELRDKGWKLSDPLVVASDPWSYRGFLQSSRGEFAIAKEGYVSTHSGWFSERSAAYLASARPVITQETGFSDVLPVGKGLLSFGTPEEALAALERVERDYATHARAAREIAEEHFDSANVLSELLQAALAPPEPRSRNRGALETQIKHAPRDDVSQDDVSRGDVARDDVEGKGCR